MEFFLCFPFAWRPRFGNTEERIIWLAESTRFCFPYYSKYNSSCSCTTTPDFSTIVSTTLQISQIYVFVVVPSLLFSSSWRWSERSEGTDDKIEKKEQKSYPAPPASKHKHTATFPNVMYGQGTTHKCINKMSLFLRTSLLCVCACTKKLLYPDFTFEIQRTRTKESTFSHLVFPSSTYPQFSPCSCLIKYRRRRWRERTAEVRMSSKV